MRIAIVFLMVITILLLKGQFTYCQVEVERYTPLASPVRAYNQIPEMSTKDKNNWSEFVSVHYPNALELNAPSATKRYNCHSYAWHFSEGGDRVWIGYYSWQKADEDIYWEDGSYIRLSSEVEATKISYYDGNHSAIQTSHQGTYISKWGVGPLMRHANNYGPDEYGMDKRNYYAIPQISGDGTICHNDIKTYSVQDFHNVTYIWSTSGNLQINGTNTNRNVSISPTSSAYGIETVFLSIYIAEYDITRTISRSFWVGAPSSPSEINGFTYNGMLFGSNSYYNFSVYPPSIQGVSIYEWVVGGGTITSGQGTNSITVLTGSGSDEMPLYFDVSVRVGNACGLSPWLWRTGYVVGGVGPASQEQSLSVSPNPTTSSFTVAEVKPSNISTPWTLRLMSQQGSVMVNVITTLPKIISVQGLQPGVYVLHARSGEYVEQIRVVVE
jgi:hypothetical protein